MAVNLSGKVVVITGASSGLGLEAAKQLSTMGCTLVLIATDIQKLHDATSGFSGEPQLLNCDVSDYEQVQQAVQQIIDQQGRVDILISNAGIWTDNELDKHDPSRRAEAFNVNSLGAIQVTEEIIPHMKAANAGHVCMVISSAGAQDSESSNNASWKTYGATKWALSGYIKALTKELVDTPIRTTAFMPGGFESDLYENAGLDNVHNQSWMMRVEDVAEVLIFALTRPADVQIEQLLVTKKQADGQST